MGIAGQMVAASAGNLCCVSKDVLILKHPSPPVITPVICITRKQANVDVNNVRSEDENSFIHRMTKEEATGTFESLNDNSRRLESGCTRNAWN